MKKLLLFAMAIMVGFAVMAQFKPVGISNALKNKAVRTPVRVDDQLPAAQGVNPTVNTKAVLDDVIGNSGTYDMQSNAAMPQHIYRWNDGTIAGVWTAAWASGASDRGSGYNYYNGTSWGTAPTARIETIRTGWPNIAPWKGNGEIVIAHNSSTSLIFNTRPVKGTGAWTQSTPLSCPTGVTYLVWPRMITNGSNFQNVHIISVGNGTLTGQTQSLLYYRSLDGGATWDKMGVQLPGTDGTVYTSFGGDDYAWMEPHGDTIAFMVGGHWTDCFLMYSYNNGSTWTKKVIVPNYYNLSTSTSVVPVFYCTDGTVAGAMDKNGVFHVAFGRMRAANDGTSQVYYPGTDGLIYWNSTMAPIDTASLANLDTLYNRGQLLGYVASNATGDSIIDFPYYGVGLSSWPQVTIDAYNNIYCMWSSLTVGNPSPDPYNYRHIWGCAKYHGHSTFTDQIDLNADITYMFMEYVYPAVAKSIVNKKLLLLTQTSSQPGSAIKVTTLPVHEVTFEYREVLTDVFIPVGVAEKQASKNSVGNNYPNPVKDYTYFDVTLGKEANVVVEVSNCMGQKVISTDMGTATAGSHKYAIDATSLTTGIYFYTVKINGESITKKMIVQ